MLELHITIKVIRRLGMILRGNCLLLGGVLKAVDYPMYKVLIAGKMIRKL
jgi:hypothetical protein